MNDTYLDQRKHFRTACELPARCWIQGFPQKYLVHLVNINETGLSFRCDDPLPIRKGDMLRLGLTRLLSPRSFEFEAMWIKKDRTGGTRVGVKVTSEAAQAFAQLVEKIRHIQCWLEVEQHLKKQKIPFAEAIRRWSRAHH